MPRPQDKWTVVVNALTRMNANLQALTGKWNEDNDMVQVGPALVWRDTHSRAGSDWPAVKFHVNDDRKGRYEMTVAVSPSGRTSRVILPKSCNGKVTVESKEQEKTAWGPLAEDRDSMSAVWADLRRLLTDELGETAMTAENPRELLGVLEDHMEEQE